MNLKDMLPAANVATGRWWTKTVTAVEGCTRLSPACDNCWAETGANMRQHNPAVAHRHKGLLTNGKYNGRIRLMHDDIFKPLHWRKPRVITWWNDLHHPDVPPEFLDRCYAVMALTPQHVHIVCTKRAEGRYEYFLGRTAIDGSGRHEFNPQWYHVVTAWLDEGERGTLGHQYEHFHDVAGNLNLQAPLPNVIQMTTAENQAMADLRIPFLLNTPAAVRAVAIEPCLAPVDLRPVGKEGKQKTPFATFEQGYGGLNWYSDKNIGWVVCGAETGPRARPMHPAWARSVRDQCEAAGVPFLFKGWGEWGPSCNHGFADSGVLGKQECTIDDCCYVFYRVGKKKAGRLLDGTLHDGYPEVMKP